MSISSTQTGKSSITSTDESITTSIIASITTSTTSNSFSSTETFVPVVPDVDNPYLMESKNVNGTVFIAAGTIIISIFMIIFIAKFWFWLKNRKAAKIATHFDDYFGNGGDYNQINDTKSNLSLLNYDSSYFDEKKAHYGISSPNSLYQSTVSSDNYTSSSSTSSASIVLANDKVSRQGHALRNALTQQTNILPYSANAGRSRNSFISPINALINEEANVTDVSQGLPVSTNTIGTPTDFKKRKTKSISKLENFENFDINSENKDVNADNKLHSRTTSMELNELEKIINNSFINNTTTSSNNKSPNSESNKSNKKNSRPPSVILDMLVQNEMDLS